MVCKCLFLVSSKVDGRYLAKGTNGRGSGPAAALFFPVSEPLQIPIRGRDRSIPWSFGEGASPPLFPLYQRTLSQLPSSSLPLNGGKGYKVSPQRPIQATVYSGNLTPAGVSASASDHYRVVREKGSERLEVRGKRTEPWFSEPIQRTPSSPGGRSGAKFKRVARSCNPCLLGASYPHAAQIVP